MQLKLDRLTLATAVVLGALALCSTARAATVTGGTTTVALNATTVGALVGLGFGITPVAPATLSGLDATFPITGGDTTMAINHSGGLAFTKSATTADIENFVINLVSNTVTGDLVAGGNTMHNVSFFDLGAGGALTLDASLAGGLSAVYGIPDLTGAPIGTATVAATAAPEPSTFGLVGLVSLAGLIVFKKARSGA